MKYGIWILLSNEEYRSDVLKYMHEYKATGYMVVCQMNMSHKANMYWAKIGW